MTIAFRSRAIVVSGLTAFVGMLPDQCWAGQAAARWIEIGASPIRSIAFTADASEPEIELSCEPGNDQISVEREVQLYPFPAVIAGHQNAAPIDGVQTDLINLPASSAIFDEMAAGQTLQIGPDRYPVATLKDRQVLRSFVSYCRNSGS
ncbi:hypothetical protein [Novosphingobium colocasiae]|uniref:hypothetical protein n=1 Tax=Novosphingobium colocasiae TaxID=1256513 RepID=UPI0016750D65|nr:hypothetical protein [Novosphingobium colocasiae]